MSRHTSVCPSCHALLRGIRCHACKFVGSPDDFAGDLCPKCGRVVNTSSGATVPAGRAPSIAGWLGCGAFVLIASAIIVSNIPDLGLVPVGTGRHTAPVEPELRRNDPETAENLRRLAQGQLTPLTQPVITPVQSAPQSPPPSPPPAPSEEVKKARVLDYLRFDLDRIVRPEKQSERALAAYLEGKSTPRLSMRQLLNRARNAYGEVYLALVARHSDTPGIQAIHSKRIDVVSRIRDDLAAHAGAVQGNDPKTQASLAERLQTQLQELKACRAELEALAKSNGFDMSNLPNE